MIYGTPIKDNANAWLIRILLRAYCVCTVILATVAIKYITTIVQYWYYVYIKIVTTIKL